MYMVFRVKNRKKNQFMLEIKNAKKKKKKRKKKRKEKERKIKCVKE